ncbi:ArsB/NhaD family transporter [Niameybacter massiliensis]|uniref:ArsB/NhaD family transporter n=1 Tax=Niameybacter massiliensis TaxID=1658108 RepID=UPI0006B4EFE9|nr:ArsB/NhaD family transporter [Niameybacter massiliensis]
MNSTQIFAILIFLVVMFFIMTEKIDRTVAAMGGAIIMVLFKIIPHDKIIGYIDFNTIGVLIGMMLVVSVVKNSGLFEYIAIFTAKKAKGDAWKILLSFALITAFLSATLDNVTTVLLIGPMTLVITQILELNPIPFLITEILASNIGGTATLIGDPPNIMIGSAAGLGFNDFLTHTAPIAVVILIVTLTILYFLYRNHLIVDDKHKTEILSLDEKKTIKDKTLLIKSLVVMAFILIGFITHQSFHMESSTVALTGAVVLLLIGKQDVEEIIGSIEWATIAFFVSLFVLVGGLEQVGIIHALANTLIELTAGRTTMTMIVLLWLSAIVSSFLDNIPFVATLIPLVLTMGAQGIDITPLWWAISLGACLGGNGTLIGASANVVLANIGEKNGYKITFGKYFKTGFPLMLLSIGIATIYLLLIFR